MRDRQYWLDQLAKTPNSDRQAVYEEAIRVCPHEELWTSYANYLLDKGSSVKDTLDKGYRAVGLWLDSSHKFWAVYLQYLGNAALESVFDAYMSRLSVPHLALDDTFQAFSEYVSRTRPAEYERILSTANSEVSKAKKVLLRREGWELRLNSSSTDRLNILSEYLETELKAYQPNSKFDFCNPLFERILTEFPATPVIWQKYIWHNWTDRIAMSKIQQPYGGSDTSRVFLQTLFDRALEFCPGSAPLIASQMRWAQMNAELDLVLTSKVLADENGLASDESVWLQYISGLYQGLVQGIIDQQQFLDNANNGLQYGSVKLLLLTATLLAKRDEQAAKAIWHNQVSKFHNKLEFWMQWLSWHQRVDAFETTKVISAYRANQKEHGIHFPEFEQDIIFYWQCENVPQAIEKALSVQFNSRPLPVPKRSADEMEVDEPAIPVAKKVVQEPAAPSRNREQSSIVVTGASEDTVRSLLKNIVSVTDADGVLLVELASPRDKLVAVSIVKYESQTSDIRAYSADETTVWVNNFQAEWQQGDIEQEFAQFGKILAVRMPSHKANTKRRFCYVQFSSARAAHLATELNGVDGLEVKISDPDQRSKRTNESGNDREVFVRGFPFDQLVATIKTFLESECSPESVRIPPGKNNKANAGYAFMSFSSSEEAKEVVEKLQNREFVGRRLLASISEPKRTRAAPGPPADARPRTLSVGNLSSSVRDEELRALFSEHGDVQSVHLEPKTGSASVVYATVRDAGKAVLAMNGQDLDNQAITVEFLKPTRPNLFRPRGLS